MIAVHRLILIAAVVFCFMIEAAYATTIDVDQLSGFWLMGDFVTSTDTPSLTLPQPLENPV